MERKQLESAAVSYPGLRGLFSIPVGLILAVGGLGNMEWGPFRQLWTVPVAALLAGLAALAIDRYYKSNYGQVTLSRRSQAKALASVTVSVPVLFAGSALDRRLDIPIWGFLASWSLMMLISYAFSVGLRAHRLVIWGSLLALCLLPVWTALGPDLKANVGMVIGGVAVVTTGIFDHRLLVRSFGSLRDPNLEGGNVGA